MTCKGYQSPTLLEQRSTFMHTWVTPVCCELAERYHEQGRSDAFKCQNMDQGGDSCPCSVKISIPLMSVHGCLCIFRSRQSQQSHIQDLLPAPLKQGVSKAMKACLVLVIPSI